MLGLKRLLTGIACVLPLFVILYFAAMVAGGFVVGMQAGAMNPEDPAAAGEQAAIEFAENHLRKVVIGSLAGALIGSAVLPFTGLFPWCRKPAVVKPPPL